MFFSNFTFFETPYQNHPSFPACYSFFTKIQLIRRNNHYLGIINLLIEAQVNLDHVINELKQELNQIKSDPQIGPTGNPIKFLKN
jgi:hypothetical protein